METLKIKKKIVELICEYSANAHPNEFGAMLREIDGIVEDLLFYPKSMSGRGHILIYDWEIPIGLDYDGTVHSHPSQSNLPSKADIEFFAKHKRRHIIICYPYAPKNMAAYDNKGNRIRLEIV